MAFFENMTQLECVQAEYSDFHKSFYGFRPRGIDEKCWNSEEWLYTQMDAIHKQMERMKETFEGREELRENGWFIEETDPELAQHAKWLQEERDRKYAEMVADLDAQQYGVA